MIVLVSASEKISLRVPFTPFTQDFEEEEVMKISESKGKLSWADSF